MVEIVKDNTDVNKLRRKIVDMKLAFKESMVREVSRLFEEVEDLDTEIKEGMSNRVGSGFMPNEAKKYAYKLIKPIMRDTLQDMEGIMKDLMTDVEALVGEGFVANPEGSAIGGLIGKANQKNFEQSELAIQVLTPPVEENKG